MSILDPIVNDKEILYDMSVTRQNQEAASRLDAVKNSFDADVRNMYNEYSELDIQQQAQKLKTAKRGDGSILQVQPGEFVPYENPAELLNKAAKENKVNPTKLRIIFDQKGKSEKKRGKIFKPPET